MIDQMTVKELQQQLDLNEINYSSKANKEELREILENAIENDEAELKDVGEEFYEESESDEDENTYEASEVESPRQATLLECMRQNKGLPFNKE